MTSGSEQLWGCSAALHTCAVEVKYVAMKWDEMSCKYNRPGQRQSLCPPRSMWPSDPRCRVSGRRLRSCGSCCCGRCRRARCIRVNSTPAPLGCGARWKTCSHSSVTHSGFPLTPFAEFVTRTSSVLLVVIFTAAAAQEGLGSSGAVGASLALVTSVSPSLTARSERSLTRCLSHL